MANYTFYVTVAGSKFVIDGVSQQTVDLGHDLTYRFDTSDSTNNGHLFKFSTTSDGTHGGGSEYTTGVTVNGTAGTSGAYTEIAVTSSTTNPLYYYCATGGHSGMGGQANTTSAEFANTTGVALKKPILANATDKWGQFSNQNLDTISGKLPQSFTFPTGTGSNTQVILSNGSGGTTWGDVALTPEITGLTWYSDSGYSSTLSASEAINIDDATYLKVSGNNLGSSGVFNTSSYVQIINTTQSNAIVGNNQSGLTGCVTSASHQSETEWRFTINPNGVGSISAGDTLKVKAYTSGGESLFATGYVISADPTSVTTVNSATISNTASVGSFGGTVAGGGQDSNTKLLLNFDRNGGQDVEDSSNNGGSGHKITATNAVIKASPFGDGKSGIYFDGSDDLLEIDNSTDFDIGSGNFTVEFWLYDIGIADGDGLFTNQTTGGLSGWNIRRSSSELNFNQWGGSSVEVNFSSSGAGIGSSNTWRHIAFVKNGDDYRFYIDGKENGHANTDNTLTASSEKLRIGDSYDGANHSNCYMDEIRIVKGSAVYTSDFTVPTSRLTAIDNTKLLIHSNNTFDEITDKYPTRTSSAVQENAGTTGTISSHSFSARAIKVVTSSNVQYYEYPIGNIGLGTNDFMVDFWIKTTGSGTTDNWIFGIGTPTALAGADFFGFRDDGGDGTDVRWNNAYKIDDGSNSVGDNTWEHWAVMRSGTTLATYKNGARQDATGTASDMTSIDVDSAVLRFGHIAGSASLTNYISEFRIVVGESIWTHTDSSGTLMTSSYNTTSTDSNATTLLPSNASNIKFLYTGSHRIVDSATTGTTHSITSNGAGHDQGHGGIASAMTFPASKKATGSAGMYFDGDQDHLNLLDSSTQNDIATTWNTGSWSLDCWLYMTAYPADGKGFSILGTTDGLTYGTDIGYHNATSGGTGYWGWIQDSSFGPETDQTTDTPALNTWMHLLFVLSWSGTTMSMKVYKDGKYLGSQGFASGSTAQKTLSSYNSVDYMNIGANAYYSGGGGTGTSANRKNWNGYIDNYRFSAGNVTADSSDPLYTNSQTSTSSNNFVSGLPTQIYGAYQSDTIDTVTLSGTAGTGGGYVTFNNATLSGQTETTSALPAGLTLNEAESTDNQATITGDLTASSGQHAINLVARATSDGTNANIDPNRKQAYSHTITKASGGAPVLFSARRYMGTGAVRDINEFGLAPDLVWFKIRSQAYHHALFDSVRGTAKFLESDRDVAENTSNTDTLTAYNADGFESGADGTWYLNKVDEKYIAWGWKAGGAPVSITSGLTGASSVTQSASSTTGFSITKYTGASSGSIEFPHNLGGTPEWILIKKLDGTGSWLTYHKDLGTGYNIFLDTNSARTGSTPNGYFGTQTSTNIVLTAGGSGNSLFGGGDYICYAWKAVSGVSAFGTYEGTGGAWTSGNNGGAQDIGFKPRFTMVKNIDADGSWEIHDSFRDESDTKTTGVWADGDWAEIDNSIYTIVYDTNGFKFTLASTSANQNQSGKTYIYCAFA